MYVYYITHPDMSLHDMGNDQAEIPARLQAVEEGLKNANLLHRMTTIEAREANKLELARAHDKNYLQDLEAQQGRETVWLEYDTAIMEHSLKAARLAAGAAIQAVDLVMQNPGNRAFCNIRPPGHHAEYNRAMGFCFYNNVAVAAAHALETYQLERIAIVDFDVHHGNGTENIFHDKPEVLFISSFQHPHYPFSGNNSAADNMTALPLSAGTTAVQWRQRMTSEALPRLDDFRPQLILVSAGFDAHASDPLGEINLHEEDYQWITGKLLEMANKHSDGRLVSMLEGGYDLYALGQSAAAHVATLFENPC